MERLKNSIRRRARWLSLTFAITLVALKILFGLVFDLIADLMVLGLLWLSTLPSKSKG